MFEFTGLADMKGWMTRSEPSGSPAEYAEAASSVVVSSRVRLARNLAAFPYPGRCPADQEAESGVGSWTRSAICPTRENSRYLNWISSPRWREGSSSSATSSPRAIQ